MYEGPVWSLNTLAVPFVGKLKLPKEEFEIYADMGVSAGWVFNSKYKLVDANGENIIEGVDFRKYDIVSF